MPKHVYLEEAKTLLWFPDEPHFNQWLQKGGLADYGLSYQYPRYQEIMEYPIDHILVNWSNRPNTYAFHIVKSNVEPREFHMSAPFRYLKDRMDGIVMKTGHLMIERAEDVVMFRMLYGEV